MARYPTPGPIGGRLIRQTVSELRKAGKVLPLTSHILIAASAGSDSTALAHLSAKYGRRLAGGSLLELLHVNHGWRGPDSEADAEFVVALGRQLGLPVTIHRVKAPGLGNSDSWEEIARRQRKAIFETEARRKCAVVMTAHQADDLAETLLWRLFTGAAKTHGGAIAMSHGVELRPFLGIRKKELKAYLTEEGQSWREDSTNHSGRFLRSQMRADLIPVIEALFPRAISHLVKLAQGAQERVRLEDGLLDSVGELFQATGLKARRPHWEALQKEAKRTESSGSIHLPGGWTLIHEPRHRPPRWILQKNPPSRTP